MEDWRSFARCRGMSADIFFDPADYLGKIKARNTSWTSKEAKKTCLGCPVVNSCLEESIIMGERYGVFGGMTFGERNAEALRRGIKYGGKQPCGTDAGYKTHKLFDEDPCDVCKEAHTKSRRERSRLEKS